MYLDVANSSTLPYGWSRCAQFSLAVVNQIHNKFTVRKDSSGESCQEKKVLYKLIFGLHSSIYVHIATDYLINENTNQVEEAKRPLRPSSFHVLRGLTSRNRMIRSQSPRQDYFFTYVFMFDVHPLVYVACLIGKCKFESMKGLYMEYVICF
ncbi:putative ubiquitinyl hydrolase 1 [Helianthus annuus]|nr:putative ubiquitinyl hydrolase 1 [Helianthus annuus]